MRFSTGTVGWKLEPTAGAPRAQLLHTCVSPLVRSGGSSSPPPVPHALSFSTHAFLHWYGRVEARAHRRCPTRSASPHMRFSTGTVGWKLEPTAGAPRAQLLHTCVSPL